MYFLMVIGFLTPGPMKRVPMPRTTLMTRPLISRGNRGDRFAASSGSDRVKVIPGYDSFGQNRFYVLTREIISDKKDKIHRKGDLNEGGTTEAGGMAAFGSLSQSS